LIGAISLTDAAKLKTGRVLAVLLHDRQIDQNIVEHINIFCLRWTYCFSGSPVEIWNYEVA